MTDETGCLNLKWGVQKTRLWLTLCHTPLCLWVRLISFPESTPICPWYVQIAWRHSSRASPKCPAWGTGHFGAGLRCMMSPQDGEWTFDKLLSVTHPNEHRGVDTGKLIERTLYKHPQLDFENSFKNKQISWCPFRSHIWTNLKRPSLPLYV